MAIPIVGVLRARLLSCGPRMWPEIARETGVSQSLLRKIAYGDRTNPRVGTIEPLLAYFAIDWQEAAHVG